MTAVSPDCELVSAYAEDGSETAFRALVSRHVDMVFATALRQTGNAALAEEITQNVFISLARKAPRLAGVQTLGGWLYRATVLETKARVRSELRRRRREATASEILTLQREGASPFAALLPLLDEALLNLREADRQALVLRYLEDRSVQEVGAVLGVDEGAARKRVSRALERLTEFFRKRGFVIPCAGGASALLSSASQAAPPAMAAAATKAALAAGGAASGVNSILFHLMKLTKTQITVACVVLAAVPLAWQYFTQAGYAREQATVNAQIAEFVRRANALETEAAQVRSAADRAGAEAANSELQLERIRTQITNPAARPRYHWDDTSPYARAPKDLLGRKRWYAIDTERGQLSDQIKQVLQMTDRETNQVQAAINGFLSNYESLEAQVIKQTPPKDSELDGHPASEVRAFDAPYLGSNQMTQLRQDFFGQVTSILGEERAGIFIKALTPWMTLTDDSGEVGSNEAVYTSNLRLVFYQPKLGNKTIIAVTSATSPQGFRLEGPLSPDQIPPLYAPYLQDWIAMIQSQAR
jgi:RNA polymerase sigma factor (sigma-70 family)